MSKSVRKIAKIVGIAALVATGVGIGFLVAGGAALGSAVGGGLLIGGASISFGTLASIGIAALSIGSLPNIKSLDQTGANQRGQAYVDSNAQAVIVFGETTVPLALVFEQEQESPQRITNVFAHAWHRIESYEQLFVDGEEVEFNELDQATGDWEGLLIWRKRHGIPNASAISLGGTVWGSSSAFEGVAHSSMTWFYSESSEKLRGGVPTRMDVVVQGAHLYDPREDSSVGGSGSQDLEDPTTWSYNPGNAALVLLRFIIGEYADGQLVWGRGAGYADIDMDSFMAMADVADEDVDGVPRFHLSGMHLLDGSFEGFVQRWEQETGGKLSKAGGIYRVWLPHDDLTPVSTITDDMCLGDSQIRCVIGEDLSTLYNTARGRYIEPDEGYRGFPYPEVTEDSAVTADGGKRVLNVDFSWVQNVEAAQRTARILVRRSRFKRVWTLTLGWQGQAPTYAPFTVHTLISKETGGNAQLVRVIEQQLSPDGRTVLVLQQEDESVYSDDVPLGDPFASNTIPSRVDRLGTLVPRYVSAELIDGESLKAEAE